MSGLLPLPRLELEVAALDHNLARMRDWCRERRVDLAPHVKTSMSPQVVWRQLAASGPAVTVATPTQAARAIEWGASEVLIANQVIDTASLGRLRRLAESPDVERVWSLVDSVDGVRLLGAAFADAPRPARVLLEVGHAGGRTGVRDEAAARRVVEAVESTVGVEAAGVSGYEGTGPNTRDDARVAAVDDLCDRTLTLFLSLAGDGRLGAEPVVSLGGSAFPDRAALALARAADVPGARRLLRSGCYATHDHGTYAQVSPVPGLRGALTVRAVVQSAPEPGTVVAAAGKRDLAYDAGWPVLLGVLGPDGAARAGLTGAVRALYDHHAVLDVPVDGPAPRVGDVLSFGISHPCAVFDRWDRYLAVHADGRSEWWTTDFRRED